MLLLGGRTAAGTATGGLAASRRPGNLQLGKPEAAAGARGCQPVTLCSIPSAPPSPQPGSLRTHQQVAARPSPVARWMGSDGQGGTRAGHRKGSSSVKTEQERGQAATATAAPQAAAATTSLCQQSRAQGHRTPQEANSRLAAASPHVRCWLVATAGQAPPLTAELGLNDTPRRGAGGVGGGGASWAKGELNQNGGHWRWVGVSEEMVCREGAGGRENYRVPVRLRKERKTVATELGALAAVSGQHLAARLKQQSLSNQPSDLQKATK